MAGITAIATGQGRQVGKQELQLGGLNQEQVEAFFESERIGLTCHRQWHQSSSSRPPRILAAAIRGYLLSHVPLVISIDQGKMNQRARSGEESILQQTGESLGAASSPTTNEHHFVVAVGCHREADRYLLNDPATYPFLRASLTQLLFARPYERLFGFLAVAAGPVRVSLLRTSVGESCQLGLLEEVETRLTQSKLDGKWPAPRLSYGLYAAGEILKTFRLVNLEELSGSHQKVLGDKLTKIVLSEVVSPHLPGKWCWIQHIEVPDDSQETSESIWIWDATKPLPEYTLDKPPAPTDILQNHLVALFGCTRGEWVLLDSKNSSSEPHATDEAGHERSKAHQSSIQARESHSKSKSIKLLPALLTSFCADGILSETAAAQDAVSLFGEQEIDAEVYLCMNGDSNALMRSFREPFWRRLGRTLCSSVISKSHGLRDSDAVEFLASISDNERQLTRIAQNVTKSFEPTGRKIIGIASFVPEISRPADSPDADLAQGALVSLLRVADQLQTLGHPAGVVEIVAGSRILGVKRNGADPTEFVAEFLTADHAMNNLITTLERSIKVASPQMRHTTRIAIELEPGEYFVVRNWNTVNELARRLRELNRKLPSKVEVGLNLDVSHWRLARISAADLSTSDVRQLIFHCHVSGHHRCGHFGDCELRADDEIQDWLDVIRSLSMGRGSGRNAGYVSLELEAASDLAIVASSCQTLKGLI